jgi:hypothetical protein
MALRQSGQAARRDGRIIAFKRGCGKMVNHFATAFFFALEKQASPGKVEYACFSISEWEAIS